MSHQVYTKWHYVLEAVKARTVGMTMPGSPDRAIPLFGKSWCDYNSLAGVMSIVSGFQHYVLSDEVIGLIDTDGGQKSLSALHDAGIKSMPYKALTVEHDISVVKYIGGPILYKARQFCVLMQVFDEPELSKQLNQLDNIDALGMSCRLHENKYLEVLPAYATLKLVRQDDGEWASRIELVTAPWLDEEQFPKSFQYELSAFRSDAVDMHKAWSDARLLLHTKGIGQQIITAPGKLNKNRAASGKAPIPTHTVLRIGKVYDREGKEVQHTGRHMRVHWRAGHVRRQRVGHGRTGVKLIFIEPVLVNYDPAGDAPVNIPHVVTT